MGKKKWKLSAHDIVNTTAPDFTELKDYLLQMASGAQLELMYRRERAMRSDDTFPIFTKPTSMTTVTGPTPAPMPPVTRITQVTPVMPAAPATATATSWDPMETLMKTFCDI